jgi:CHAD domain-containing protein
MKARRIKKLDPGAPLIDNAARIIPVRLAELRSFAPAALDSRRSTEQHDMRIAAKRLRYVLEATELCFGKPAVGARRRAKAIQDVLGELHDCDVILPRIESHAARLRHGDAELIRAAAGDAADLDPALSAQAAHRTSYRGLEILAVHVEARRRLLFDRFTELWERTQRERVFERLERAIALRA